MIATPRFVFLHLHKSGGTFVNEWLLRFIPGAREVGYHLPRRLIPAELRHLPVLGLVRNPWSYYLSWYTFQSSRAKPNALFQILSDDGRNGFETTIRNMVELGSGSPHLDVAVRALPSDYGAGGLNLPGPQLAQIRDSGRGFYSFLYDYFYAGGGPVRIARMERMREELPPLLSATGEAISDTAKSHLTTAPARNASLHGPYAEYYGSALRDLVGERDASVIKRHHYRFGD
jgi:hypothetical protein